MKRLSLYITSSHASCTIENGATRETSAHSVSQMLDAMPQADRGTLVGFCAMVVAYDNEDPQDFDPKKLNSLVVG